jgi:hypothetical protein
MRLRKTVARREDGLDCSPRNDSRRIVSIRRWFVRGLLMLTYGNMTTTGHKKCRRISDIAGARGARNRH